MKNKTNRKILSVMLAAGMFVALPAVDSQAAVITSNATDKTAVVFDANTAYSAGDYVTYDGEMFICTAEVQGMWDTAKDSFMQITKNQELGNREDLSAAYDASADPGNEKSLMAFVANAWQKLKVFLGTETRTAQTDQGNYQNASVSAKLNFLKEQNEGLDGDVAQLQEDVNRSFQFVSNGKSLLADTITDKGVFVHRDAEFSVINNAINEMAKMQYDNGNEAGYTKGHEDGKADGIKEADGRVNEDSESYKQALKNVKPQVCTIEAKMNYIVDNEDVPYLSYEYGEYNSKTWTLHYELEGHTIIGVRAWETSRSDYSSGFATHMALSLDGSYPVVTSQTDVGVRGNPIVVTNDSVTWDGFSFGRLEDEYSYASIKLDIIYI